MCVCMCEDVCCPHVRKPEDNLWKWVLIFYYVGSRDWLGLAARTLSHWTILSTSIQYFYIRNFSICSQKSEYGDISGRSFLWNQPLIFKKSLLAIFKGTTSQKCFSLPASDQNSLFCETHHAFRYWCGLGFRNLVSRCHSWGYGLSLWPHGQTDRDQNHSHMIYIYVCVWYKRLYVLSWTDSSRWY